MVVRGVVFQMAVGIHVDAEDDDVVGQEILFAVASAPVELVVLGVGATEQMMPW